MKLRTQIDLVSLTKGHNLREQRTRTYLVNILSNLTKMKVLCEIVYLNSIWLRSSCSAIFLSTFHVINFKIASQRNSSRDRHTSFFFLFQLSFIFQSGKCYFLLICSCASGIPVRESALELMISLEKLASLRFVVLFCFGVRIASTFPS